MRLTATRTAIASSTGLHLLEGERYRHLLVDRPVGAVAAGPTGTLWALVDRRHLHRLDPAASGAGPELVASLPAGAAGVCLAVHRGTVWVGGDRAGLWRLDGAELVPVGSFATAPTHDAWYTPWGGPPAVFSLASVGDDLYASVHVGGILHSADGGRSWRATLDLHDDVHQVAAGADGHLWAATGDRALAGSSDGGTTWRHHHDGLDGELYLLAVAPVADGVIVGASHSHASREGNLYRFDGERFHRLGPAEGLPGPLGGVVGPRQLAAAGDSAAVALPGGGVAASADGGRTWEHLDLPLLTVAEVATLG